MLLKRYLVLVTGVLLFILAFIVYFEVARADMESRFRDERVKYGVDGAVLTTADKSEGSAPAVPTESAPVLPASNLIIGPVPPPGTTPDNNVPAPAPAEAADASAPSTPAAAPTPAASDSTAPSVSSLPPTAAAPEPNPAPNAPGPDATAPSVSSLPPTAAPGEPAAAPNPPAQDSTIPAPVNLVPTTPDTNAAPLSPAPPSPTSAPMAPSSTINFPTGRAASFLVYAAWHPSRDLATQLPSVELAQTTTPADPVSTPVPAPAVATPPSMAPATNVVATAPVAPEPARASPVQNSVIVLLYHQFVPAGAVVSPKFQWTLNQDVFESEMKYIHDNGYHVISMVDLEKFLRHEIFLPPNPVVITIDDGYKSAIVYAAPILKKYGFPWTYFVYPEFITENEGSGAASWNDLLALQADGVDIESHSMTHPTLTKRLHKFNGTVHNLSPEEYDQWLTIETAGAKELLEKRLGKPVICYAYPYGAYNKQVEAKAIAAGYQYIFTVADNPVRGSTSPYSIGRYTITRSVVKNFTAYLHQGALGIGDIDPGPGTTTNNPRPVITAVLGYAGTLDPNSIETEVRDFGDVRHDYDPKTSTLRLYLPRDLIQSQVLVNIRVKDAETGKVMVANWYFNYEPVGGAAVHAPIAPATNAAPVVTPAPTPVMPPIPAPAPMPTPPPVTNAPAAPAVQ